MLRQCNTFEHCYLSGITRENNRRSCHCLQQALSRGEDIGSIQMSRFLCSLPPEYADFARSYDAELETTELNDYRQICNEFNNRINSSIASASAIVKVSSSPTSTDMASSYRQRRRKEGTRRTRCVDAGAHHLISVLIL
jgi:hypothetical protein